MKEFLIVFAAIVVILLLIVMIGGNKPFFRKIFRFFVEEVDEDNPPPPIPTPADYLARLRNTRAPERPRRRHNDPRRSAGQTYTEMAMLMQKIDERRRVVDSNGHSTLYDEYFELVFETRRGEMIHLKASRAAFKEIPFNQSGSLTFRNGTLIKFKCIGGLISDEYSPAQR